VNWRRLVRIGLVLVVVATVAGVALSVRRRPKPSGATAVARLDPKAAVESAGGRLMQTTGMRIPGFVDFDHNLTYADGSMKLMEPRLTTSKRGREYHLTGKEASIGANQSHMTVNGDVVLTASDGLRMTTDEASYSSGEQVVRAPHRVEFAKGTMTGSAVGMTYDQQRDVLWLLDQVAITVAPDRKADDPGAKISAGTAGFARREKYMRFEKSMSLVRGGRTIAADNAMAYLTDDEKAIKAWELRGHSHIGMSGAAPGALQAMDSRDMNITYGPDGESIQRAILSGDGVVQMAGAGGTPGRRIAGQTVDVTLADDGSVTALVVRDHVEFALPADKDSPARLIKASAMQGAGEPGKGLTGATFKGGVEFREDRQPSPRIAHSRTLSVVLTDDGGLGDAMFGGGTRFEDGTTRASGADARYLVNQGRLELRGNVGTQAPQVQDERITVNAEQIDMSFDGPMMKATTNVQSVMQGTRKADDAGKQGGQGGQGRQGEQGEQGRQGGQDQGGQGAKAGTGAHEAGKGAPKTPGLLKDDQPAYVTGAALDYDGAKGKAVYTGGARLWQADTAISGDTITIDDDTGDLYASTAAPGLMRSTFVLDQLDTKTGQTRKVPTIAAGQDMHYEDALRRATYTTKAHVNGPQGDLRGVKIELYLVEGGGALERVEAYDDVNLKTDARTATGKRMTYFAADERYLMTGTPVTVVEECRVTTGKTLTFWRSTDRILIDGNDQNRTLATSGGTCGQTSPK
jgi:LPS export ABC transporter protein LptC